MGNFNEEKYEQNLQYQAFKEAGGSLTEEDFRAVSKLLEQMSKKLSEINDCVQEAKRATINQFNSEEMICKRIGITTSQTQKAIYCFLRHYEKRGNLLVARASKLTDQEIMADIILMTGTAMDYNKYVERYPAIAERRFPKTEMKEKM